MRDFYVQTSSNVPRPTFSKADSSPARLDMKMITGFIATNSASGETGASFYKPVCDITLNSGIKPNRSSYQPGETKGIQPLHWDQMKRIYNKSVVTAAKIDLQILYAEVEVVPPKDLRLGVTSWLHRGDDTAVPTDKQACSSNTAQFSVINSRQRQTPLANPENMVTISRFVNMSKYFGQDVRDTTGSYWEHGQTSIAPLTHECRFSAKTRPLNEIDIVVSITHFRIQLEQYVTFGDKIRGQ